KYSAGGMGRRGDLEPLAARVAAQLP
nr:VP1 [foot-and-mouth disease virus, A22, Peptide Partial, 25 aa] [Foot-and-mouth disease virus]